MEAKRVDLEKTIEKSRKIKKQFDEEHRKEKEIEEKIEKVIKNIKNVKFNPNNNNIIEIYDIMDSFSEAQIDITKLWALGMSYDSSAQALLKTFQNTYKELHDEMLTSEEVKKSNFKNITEKNSYIDNQLREYYKYVLFAEKQVLKGKELLGKVKLFADLINQFDNKVSRKVSVMQIQEKLGTLPMSKEKTND